MGHEEQLSPEQIDPKISALRGALKRTWCDFCATSSIHGLKYTRDKDTNRVVHLVWKLISVVMFICAIVMTHTFYADYRSSPTRMNVENDHTPVSKLYFPPITICPEVLFNMDKSKAYIESLWVNPYDTLLLSYRWIYSPALGSCRRVCERRTYWSTFTSLAVSCWTMLAFLRRRLS